MLVERVWSGGVARTGGKTVDSCWRVDGSVLGNGMIGNVQGDMNGEWDAL